MLNVKKRDGSILEFKLSKIESAIERAFMAEHKFYNKDIIEMLALRTTAEFNKKVKDDVIDNPELINEDPYTNWICKLELSDASEVDNLLSKEDYEKEIDE